MVDISNAVFPDHPTTVEDERESESERLTRPNYARLVIEGEAGIVVGWAQYQPQNQDKLRYNLEIYIHPSRQGEGFGKQLYSHLLMQISALGATHLDIPDVKEDLRGLRFLQERGCIEVMRFWQAHLNVNTFDPARFRAEEDAVRAKGIIIRTLRELQEDAGWDQRLYSLGCAVSADVPQTERYVPPTFEDFLRELPTDTGADRYFVAVQDDVYIGLHLLVPRSGTDHLRIVMTGVRAEYRRQGIALALKLRGVAYARTNGHPILRTMNETNNLPIITLNDQLGFVRQPAWIQMVYTF
jgi:GNAT superfamily N-acetyltransferase